MLTNGLLAVFMYTMTSLSFDRGFLSYVNQAEVKAYYVMHSFSISQSNAFTSSTPKTNRLNYLSSIGAVSSATI